DQVHLVRRVRPETEVRALGEVAHRFDTVVRRRVELEQVEEAAVGDRDAVLADAARVTVGLTVGAIGRFGNEPPHRGFPGAARTGEEIRVPDAAVSHGVAHRRGDVLLSDHVGESLRSVLAVERLVRHVATLAITGSGTGRLASYAGRPVGRPAPEVPHARTT